MSSTAVTFNHKWAKYQAETLRALHADEYDLVVLRTGYGGGKSLTGSRWVHRTALQRGGEYLVLAPDYQKGGPATYRVFFEELPGEQTVPNDAAGGPENSPVVAGYNANQRRLTYANGAVARLGSADKWNRYAGSEFNGIYCDEPAHYDNTDLYDLHEMLVSRQRTEAGPNVMLWTSTGAGYDQYYDITERKVTPDDDPLPWADQMRVIVGSSLDNPFLPEKAKMRAQFEDTPREAQALHGGFAAAEGLVYDQFSRTTHVKPRSDVDIRDDGRLYGYDYGWQDPRVVIEYGKTHADQYVAWDMYHVAGKPVEHAIAWLRDNDKPAGPIYCDHDPEHIDKFRQAGYPAEKATKDIDEGIQEVQAVLETDDDGRPGLIVVDELTELIQEFQSYKEEDVGTSRAEDHALDVTRYAVMGDRYTEEKASAGAFGTPANRRGGNQWR